MPEPAEPITPIEAAERFVATTKARIEHGGDRAYYRSTTDSIQMPDKARFAGTESTSPSEAYYGTLLHELTH